MAFRSAASRSRCSAALGKVGRDGLLAVLEPVLASEALACVQALAEKPQATELAACGPELRFLAADLRVELSLPLGLRRERRLAVRPAALPTATVGDAGLSAYLNQSVQWRQAGTEGQRQVSEGLALDGALRWRGLTFEFDGRCADGDCTPGLRSLVADRPESLKRWRAGDLPEAGAGSLFVPALRGAGVSTLFELAPGERFTARLEAPIEVLEPADVEIRVDDRLIERYRLGPGRYTLSDFPLPTGAGAVSVRIVDDAGRETLRRYDTFVDLALLGSGRSRHALHLGRPLLPLPGEDGTEERPLVLAGEYARGLSDRSTLSLATVSVPALGRHAAEVSLVHGTGSWLTGAELACSLADERACRVQVGLRNLDPGDREGAFWSHEALASWRGAGYAEIHETGAALATANLSWRARRALSERWQLGLGARARWIDGTLDQRSMGLGIYGRLGGDWQARLGVERNHERSEGSQTRFEASLAWRFDGGRQALGWGYDHADSRQQLRWQFAEGTRRGGLGLAATAESGADDALYSLAADWRHERGSLSGGWSRSADASERVSEERRLALRSALVYADGAFSISERVVGGFAIVDPADRVAAGPVYVDPIEDDYAARGSPWLPAVVPGIRPYQPRPLTIGMPELAPGRDPGEQSPIVTVGYKGGARIVASGQRAYSIRLQPLDASGNPVPPSGARLSRPDGSDARSAFVGRGGVLRMTGLAPGHWVLELDGRPTRRHAFEIPAAADSLIDLGALSP